jgi:hypothetical protein
MLVSAAWMLMLLAASAAAATLAARAAWALAGRRAPAAAVGFGALSTACWLLFAYRFVAQPLAWDALGLCLPPAYVLDWTTDGGGRVCVRWPY